jgi:hypothetical protein
MVSNLVWIGVGLFALWVVASVGQRLYRERRTQTPE